MDELREVSSVFKNRGELTPEVVRRILLMESKYRTEIISMEYVLDFYDEACAAVHMGVCDEDTLRYYLGPLMAEHAYLFSQFIPEWREKYKRKEKWSFYTELVEQWTQHSSDRGKPLSKTVANS